MAHNVETMAWACEVPWHGLGKEVPRDLSPEQMLKAAGLDWTVEKIPTFIRIKNKEYHTGKHALVRSSDNSILDVVSNDWLPVQNREAFEFFNDYVHAGDMEMHTAGSLRKGQIVWALAKIKEGFEIFGGDKIEGYLMFTNPHRWGQSIDVRFTPIRVVCNNTLTMALNEKGSKAVKVNHRSEFDPEEVKEVLGIANNQLQKYKESALFLGSKRYKKDTVKDYLKELFPVLTQKEESRKVMSKTADVILNGADGNPGILETQPGAEFAPGSWWQAFNAVTYFIDHKAGRTAEGRLTSSWFGLNRNLKIKALDKALEYAAA
jgi:phage/plasmid-like protein (TIGR03299 family)